MLDDARFMRCSIFMRAAALLSAVHTSSAGVLCSDVGDGAMGAGSTVKDLEWCKTLTTSKHIFGRPSSVTSFIS